MDILGFQEAISDAIEIISDEINKQVRERKAKKEKIDAMNELKRMLENVRERLRQAENIEDEKNRIIAELQAYESILEIFKTIEEKYAPKKEERRIDWSKVGERIREIIRVINEQGIQRAIEFIRREFPEASRGFIETWPRVRRRGLI
jgi:DNA repair exonuclease SbcCD ATPase subunit